jgi:signal transduction histidine kinase
MKRSFFRKLLLGSLTILVIIFIGQWSFQQLWIEQAVLSRTKNQIEMILADLEEQPTNVDVQSIMDRLTTTTGSFNTLLNTNDAEQQTLELATITISSNNNNYTILRPRIATGMIRLGTPVEGRFYSSSVADVYVPIEITIGARRLSGNPLNSSFSAEIFEQLGVDTSSIISLSGNIVEINDLVIQDTRQSLYNSELLNLLSQSNITDLTQTDRWVQYTSVDEVENPVNLVYVTPLILNQESLLLVTIYPLGTIRTITQSLSTISILSLFSAVIVTMLLYGWFFKRVSVPLQQVNEATRRFSLLDFDPIPITNSNDEIEDLARNINILSATLSTTLTELEDRNVLLHNQLSQERINDQRREELVAGISHELKTPLAIIQATIEAISLGIVKKSELQMHQQTMEQEIVRANTIITNLLHLQHQNSTQSFPNQVVSLDEIIKAIIDQYQPLIQQRGLNLQQSITPYQIEVVPQRIELVISNLISNAIKYSSPDSTIIIRLDKSSLQICNATTLPNDTNTDSLFLPFHRVDKSRSRHDGSTGLGLSIVKQILDQHEFDFKCQIKDGTFCMIIQFKPQTMDNTHHAMMN